MKPVDAFISAYPRIFRACHLRHVRDARSKRVLSAHQAAILDHLDPREPLQLHALARHLGVTPSTMSLHIDRLQRAGFVRRTPHPTDRRRTNLLLTPAGVRIKLQQKVLDPGRVAALLGRLSPADRTAAIHALQMLARAADSLFEAPA